MGYDDQDLAVQLMRHGSLCSWLDYPGSSALLVHGHGTDTTRSPVSFASAKLVESLFLKASTIDSKIMPLAFFCGEHINQKRDSYSNPRRMVLYLILQVLDQQLYHGQRMDPNLLEYAASGLDVDSISSLCGLFESMLLYLPSQLIVFIVIDGVSHFEDSGRKAEMMEIINRLVGMVESGKGPILKLLTTSPKSTMSAWKIFRGLNDISGRTTILDLKSSYVGGVGFNALGWNSDMDQRILELCIEEDAPLSYAARGENS